MTTDVLVIGSGIAGLAFALQVAEDKPHRSIIILTKAEQTQSNTSQAQGGIAAVMDEENDSFSLHAEDTIKAGANQNDPSIVHTVVEEAPDRIRELEQWGVRFDQNTSGQYALGKEGGHSTHRILHHQDRTGGEILLHLWSRVKEMANIEVIEAAFAIDLLLDDNGKCVGTQFLDKYKAGLGTITAAYTILATGGIGQVYPLTTNPIAATGDGIAMAERAGATIRDMEMVQFHPTAIDWPGLNPAPLLTEALRGAGARLCNHEGVDFMKHYHPLADLAPRDVVSRAIDNEKRQKGTSVYLDASAIPEHELLKHFPGAWQLCEKLGCQLASDPIPVIPAPHFICGGIAVDQWGRTSIPDLYACGECAHTGLHGANRLASNSLLEALVFAHRCYRHVTTSPSSSPPCLPYMPQPERKVNNTVIASCIIDYYIRQTRDIMAERASITKSNDGLQKAVTELAHIEKILRNWRYPPEQNPNYWELRNMLSVARLIVDHALRNRMNVGVHYNHDYPQYAKNQVE